MASLTSAAVVSRKVIRYGIYAIVALIIVRFAFNGLVGIYKRAFPPEAPPPSVKYGTLGPIPFPNQEEANITYDLEFLSDVQKLPDQTEVYFIPKPATNITVLDAAKEKANSLGFDPEGRELVETIYSFNSHDGLSTLNMNVVTNAFSITYNTDSNPNVLDSRAPEMSIAEDFARSKLQGANLLPPDLAEGLATTQYLKKLGDTLVPAISLSEAVATKVNFHRKPLGTLEIPSVTSKADESNAWFVIASPSTVLASEYHHFPIDETESATYPLKTLDQAFEDLKNNEGYIASRGSNVSDHVLITNVYLAYFDPSQYTEFYQPVIVFENEDGFKAYVPAVTDQYYSSVSPEAGVSEVE